MSNNDNNDNQNSKGGGMISALFVLFYQWVQQTVIQIDHAINNFVHFVSFGLIHIHTHWLIGLFILIVFGLFILAILVNLFMIFFSFIKMMIMKANGELG